MTTFAITSDKKSDALNNMLKQLYGEENTLIIDDHLRIVLSDKDITAEDVFKKLNESKEEYGKFVIFSINSYFGYHTKSIWDWLKAKGV